MVVALDQGVSWMSSYTGMSNVREEKILELTQNMLEDLFTVYHLARQLLRLPQRLSE